MNQPSQRTQQRRRPAKRTTAPRIPDLWKPAPAMPPVEPIEMPHEVGAVLRSLGDPPTHNGAASGRYFNTVVQRAAAVALALAISVDLLAHDDRD
jgi:hypothetical protein